MNASKSALTPMNGRAWVGSHFQAYFLNSIKVVAVSLFLIVGLGAMASYALARFTFVGRELIYTTADHKVMAVDVRSGAMTFEAGIPKQLFAYQFKPGGWPLDTADGQRFLINESLHDQSATPITVVVNFAAGLKSRR